MMNIFECHVHDKLRMMDKHGHPTGKPVTVLDVNFLRATVTVRTHDRKEATVSAKSLCLR